MELKALLYFHAKPFSQMKGVLDFYDSGTTYQFGHNPRIIRRAKACCGTNFVQQQRDSRAGIISLSAMFPVGAKSIWQGNMDKPHGFCPWMVKDQSDAGAKGIGAQYIFRTIGDGPATDFHHFESAHAIVRVNKFSAERLPND